MEVLLYPDLPDYELFDLLETGSILTLHKARRKDDHLSVLVKSMSRNRGDRDQEASLSAEVLAWRDLGKAVGLLVPLDFIVHELAFYLVTEFQELSKDARELAIDRTAESGNLLVLSPIEITMLTCEVLNTLAAVHLHPAVLRHGDIKPNHIFYILSDPDFCFKLITGLGCVYVENALQAVMKDDCAGFTPLQMSPEIIRKVMGFNTKDDIAIGQSSDMWSLGASLLQLSIDFMISDCGAAVLSRLQDGRWTFDEDVMTNLNAAQNVLWSKQNPWVRDLIRGCLQCEAKDRPIPNDVTHSTLFAVITPVVVEYRKLLKELASAKGVVPPTPPASHAESESQNNSNNNNHDASILTSSSYFFETSYFHEIVNRETVDTILKEYSFDYDDCLVLTGHEGIVFGACELCDGRIASCEDVGHCIKVWSTETGFCLATWPQCSAVCYVISIPVHRLVAGLENGRIVVLDDYSGDHMIEMIGHTGPVTCLQVMNGIHLMSSSQDGTICVWDANTGRSLCICNDHDGWIHCIAVLSTSTPRVASACEDMTVRLWEINPQDGQCACVLKLRGHVLSVQSVAALPNNKVISGDLGGFIRVWNGLDGMCLNIFRVDHTAVWNFGQLNNGSVIISGQADGTLTIWDYNHGKLLKCVQGHHDGIYRVIVLQDGRVATCSDDSTIRIWH